VSGYGEVLFNGVGIVMSDSDQSVVALEGRVRGKGERGRTGGGGVGGRSMEGEDEQVWLNGEEEERG
jgi:hypothetical protein